MPDNPQAVLDHHARQLGFPNYETWKAWNMKYGPKSAMPAQAPVQQKAPTNWFQTLLEATPFGVIKRVTDRYGEATGY